MREREREREMLLPILGEFPEKCEGKEPEF